MTHYFQNPGTYTVTVKTTDFGGVETTSIIGIYTVKARIPETSATDILSWNEPEADLPEFLPQVEQSAGVTGDSMAVKCSLPEPEETQVAGVSDTEDVLGIAEIDMYYRVEEEYGHGSPQINFFMGNESKEMKTIVDRLVADSDFLEETFQPFDEWVMPQLPFNLTPLSRSV